MTATIKNVILVAATATAAFAGQIKVGTVNNGYNHGLTGNTLTNLNNSMLGYMRATPNCIGSTLSQPGFTNCQAPVVGAGAATRNYQATMWGGLLPANPGPNGEPGGLQYTGLNGVTYAMIADGGSSTANYWSVASSSSTPVSVTIPIGVIGVNRVDIMLNDLWGANGVQNTTVFFDFNTASDGTGTTTTRTFNLTNGTEIRSTVLCNAGSGPCTNVARNLGTPGTPTGNTEWIGTSAVYTGAYTGTTTGVAAAYSGTAGTLTLDSLAFSISSADSARWLSAIRVSNVNGATGTSRTALSAITLTTADTPEPGTLALLLGVGAIAGFGRRFRKA